ncbi:MAG: type III secretion system chaperone [Lentisphaeria bacterium]|nr:type III secretion system chaperone [Lentisphaeria bacterium]
MNFPELMKAFGEGVNLKDFAPNGNGVFQLDIDGMVVSIAEVNEGKKIACIAEVCDLPAQIGTRLYRLMLEAMFMGKATGGAVLSIEHESSKVYLHEMESLKGMELEDFRRLLENFTNTLEEWRDRIREFRDIEPALDEVQERNATGFRGMGMGDFIQV